MTGSGKSEFILLVCDSGLGGIDVARRLMVEMRDRGAPASRVRVIYFNAWPEVGRGYNHLSTLGEKLRVFRQALAGMLEFHPDAVVIGCNTLSILREVAGVETTVPLVGIVDAAETMLYHYLSGDEERRLVVFGTETTVGSGLYRERLRRRGIDPRRVIGRACPGLATRIEAGPERPEIAAELRGIATDLRRRCPDLNPEKTALGLCCTHYGYSSRLWESEFTAVFGGVMTLLDPNTAFPSRPEISRLLSGTAVPEFSAEVHSRIPLTEVKRRALAALIAADAPELAEALNNYHFNPELFTPF